MVAGLIPVRYMHRLTVIAVVLGRLGSASVTMMADVEQLAPGAGSSEV